METVTGEVDPAPRMRVPVTVMFEAAPEILPLGVGQAPGDGISLEDLQVEAAQTAGVFARRPEAEALVAIAARNEDAGNGRLGLVDGGLHRLFQGQRVPERGRLVAPRRSRSKASQDQHRDEPRHRLAFTFCLAGGMCLDRQSNLPVF